MKSNKGFTLIELLAVIVILAIIALIATPMILGVIETARKGSAESSVLGYVDAVEKQLAIDMLGDENLAQITIHDDGTATPKDTFQVKGTTPDTETVNINTDDKTVADTCFEIKIGGTPYSVQYTAKGSTAKVVTSCPTN